MRGNPTSPTDQLLAEHGKIQLLLDVVDRLGDLALVDKAPLDRIAAALDLIRGYADGLHHSKEEAVLFPLLEAKGMRRDRGPIGCMLREHDVGREAVADMAAALDALRGGQDAGGAFHEAAASYTALLRDHISKEDEVLFPWAESIIDDDDRAQLETSFDRVESEDVGAARVAEMLATLQDLADEFLRKPAP